jgi:hypothetical protein
VPWPTKADAAVVSKPGWHATTLCAGTSRERSLHCRGLFGDFPPAYPPICPVLFGFRYCDPRSLKMQKVLLLQGFYWSEREDLNLRPLVSQTSALTGLRHAPMPFH